MDNIEQSQSSCVIIGLGQERNAKKPIVYISLQSLYFLHKLKEREREREREREMIFAIIASQIAKKSKIIATGKLKRA